MKTLLVAVNAKYVHSSLAIRYLSKGIGGSETAEYTINDRIEGVTADICKKSPAVIAFSCYIWNFEFIIKICRRIKKLMPDTVIVLGGPEVSYDAPALLREYPFVDYVVAGEGDFALPALVAALESGQSTEIKGVFSKGDGKDKDEYIIVSDLNAVPRPYAKQDIEDLKGKILYYETSRGCPFSCSYCLSGTFPGVRYIELERVLEDISLFCQNNVRLVKLVDRTFNANQSRAVTIIREIKKQSKGTRFHFEVTAELLTDEFIKEIAGRPELFQLEIGVQSTNLQTLCAINRKNNLSVIAENVCKLKNAGIHVHLDAIAGLPFEDYNTFQNTFNDIYALKPDAFQLGFLKLLKGSLIRRQEKQYGYVYAAEPPYEVLYNSFLSYEELLTLKDIENALEKYYNSGAFEHTLRYLENKFESPFSLFKDLAEGLEDNMARKQLFLLLHEKYKTDAVLKETLIFDFLLHEKGQLFEEERTAEFVQLSHDLIHNGAFVRKYLSAFEGKTAREIFKTVRFRKFDFRIWDDFGDGRFLAIFQKGKFDVVPFDEAESYLKKA